MRTNNDWPIVILALGIIAAGVGMVALHASNDTIMGILASGPVPVMLALLLRHITGSVQAIKASPAMVAAAGEVASALTNGTGSVSSGDLSGTQGK